MGVGDGKGQTGLGSCSPLHLTRSPCFSPDFGLQSTRKPFRGIKRHLTDSKGTPITRPNQSLFESATSECPAVHTPCRAIPDGSRKSRQEAQELPHSKSQVTWSGGSTP